MTTPAPQPTPPLVASWLALTMAGVMLSACGADTVGAAATGAAVKQQELQNAQRTQQQVQQDVQKALELSSERKQQLDP